MLKKQATEDDFPTMQMVRTAGFVRMMGRYTFLALVVSIIAMFFVPWRQTAKGIGTVVALNPQERPQSVLSQSDGVVSYVKPGLTEGSYVEAGELLLRLTPKATEGVSRIDSQIVTLENKDETARFSLKVAEQSVQFQEQSGRNAAESLKQEFEASKQKYEQTRNEVTSLQAELEDKENQLSIAEKVVSRGLISREELFTKRRAVESQFAKVRKAQNAVNETFATLEAKEEEILSKLQEIEIKNRTASQKVLEAIQKINTIEKEILELRNKRNEFDRLDVVAPRSGYIQEWFGLEGSDTVKAGKELFVIVPDTNQLSVEMKVTGNDIPLIHEGDPVRLEFNGWPAVQVVGWPSQAVGTFGGKVNRVFPTDDSKGYFRVLVTPEKHFEGEKDWPIKGEKDWQNNRYLRQGGRVNGWVLLKRVPLGYEIWRQLNGFPPEAVKDDPDKDKPSKVKLPKA